MRWGLVRSVVPAATCSPRRGWLADQIAAASPLAVQAVKEIARRGEGLSVKEPFEAMAAGDLPAYAKALAADEFAEQARDFAERRTGRDGRARDRRRHGNRPGDSPRAGPRRSVGWRSAGGARSRSTQSEPSSRGPGSKCLVRPTDLREPDEADALVDETLAAFGRIDVLVNNAGGQFTAPAEEITLKGWRAVHRLTVDAAWHLTREIAVRSMIPNGAGVIFFNGFSPRRGLPGYAHAAAARAALENLARRPRRGVGPTRHSHDLPRARQHPHRGPRVLRRRPRGDGVPRAARAARHPRGGGGDDRLLGLARRGLHHRAPRLRSTAGWTLGSEDRRARSASRWQER